MTGRLTSYVHLPDGRVFGPEDEVPGDAAALITNPAAWVGGAQPTPPPVTVETGPAVEPAAEPAAVPGKPPPRTGRGSGLDSWAAYAVRAGVEIPDGADRDTVIGALHAAGVPVERTG